MRPRDPGRKAAALLRKAEADLVAVRRLMDDVQVADEIVAFHGQQAAEKSIKAVLGANGIAVRKSHDLAGLIDMARRGGLEIPEWVDEVAALTPFAVAFRYEAFLEDDEPFDRARMLDLVVRVVAWARDLIEQEV